MKPTGPDNADDPVAWLHPECPDLHRLAPNGTEALLRARAARVEADHDRRDDLWRRGFTRRQALAGAGLAGVASLGAQLVTTRASFALAQSSQPGALVVIFLRGGMDGLSVLVPADDPHLLDVRPQIAVPGGALLPLARGFGLHPALEPLHELWNRGQLTAVPAVATPDLSRSHFQAQDCLERGGSNTGTTTGWLDRVLEKMEPGTTFRAVGQGATLPRSLVGNQPAMSLNTVKAFRLIGRENLHERTKQALSALYTGFDHPIAADVETTLSALETTSAIIGTTGDDNYQPDAPYPDNDTGKGLSELARLIKADVGLRVAAMDIGGWDTHVHMGTVDDGSMRNHLSDLAQALRAFADDLGPRLDDVTVVTMSEFGRRVEQNGNNGTDHGHGGVGLLMGGGLTGGTVHGDWPGLAPEVLEQGDVPGANDYRDLLGDVVAARLGLSEADLADVFPGHRVQRLGVMG